MAALENYYEEVGVETADGEGVIEWWKWIIYIINIKILI